MRKLIGATLLAGAVAAFQSALATQTLLPNNLYMGFENAAGNGTADYIINFGPATNVIGKATVVDLSSDFLSSLFNAASLQGTANDIKAGVVGGSNAGTPSDVYATLLRTGNVGNPGVAGSTSPGSYTRGQVNAAYTPLTSLNCPTNGPGFLDTTKSWESEVEPAFTASTFYGNAFNPDSAVSTSSVLYEDLWLVSNGASRGTAPWIYLGYFTLDLTGASPKLTFSSTNVPPTLTLTAPSILSVAKQGSTVTVVSTNAVATFHYQLLYTASLSPTNWIPVGSSLEASGVLVTNSDTTATAAQRFYRVQAQ